MNPDKNFKRGKFNNIFKHLLSQQATLSVALIFNLFHSASFAFPVVQIDNLKQENRLNSQQKSIPRRSPQKVAYLSAQSARKEYVSIANPDLPEDFCKGQVHLVFIVDESGSVDEDEENLQRQAIVDTLQYLTNNNINAQLAIISFAWGGRFLTEGYIQVNRTTIAPDGELDLAIQKFANIASRARQRTYWEGGLQEAVYLAEETGIYPEALFFFTDGRNERGNVDDEADNLKSNGTHIYTIGLGNEVSVSLENNAYKDNLYRLTDGANSINYDFNNSNPLLADHITVETYNELSDSLLALFQAGCPEVEFYAD